MMTHLFSSPGRKKKHSQSFIITRGLIVRGRLYYQIREDYGIAQLVGVSGAEG